MRWNQSSSVQKLEEGSRREVSFDSVQKLDFVRRKTLVSGLISIYGLLPEDWCDKRICFGAIFGNQSIKYEE
jgi:hypothetical protein